METGTVVVGQLREDADPGDLIGEPVGYELFAGEEPAPPPPPPPPPSAIPADEPVLEVFGLGGYHLAPVLKVLRDEVDRRWPRRDRTSDGWIGDAAHQAGPSDHNPDADNRSVNALDIDRDGIDPALVVRKAIAHPSTQYVIFDRTIWSRTRNFAAARYTGSNPHDRHLHVSVSHRRELEQSTRGWGIADAPVPTLGDRLLRRGDRGSDVREMQTLARRWGAGLVVDGVFGPKTEAWVREFQRARKLTVDGVVGPRTVAALRTAPPPPPPPGPSNPNPSNPNPSPSNPTPPVPKLPTPRHAPGSRTLRRSMTGDDVAFVQRYIGEKRCGKPTGTFDARTETGVRWYQRMRGIAVDGVVGRQTWRQMQVKITY